MTALPDTRDLEELMNTITPGNWKYTVEARDGETVDLIESVETYRGVGGPAMRSYSVFGDEPPSRADVKLLELAPILLREYLKLVR